MKESVVFAFIAVISVLASAQESFHGLRFEKNLGQWEKEILYQAQSLSGVVRLTDKGLNVVVKDTATEYRHTFLPDKHTNTNKRYSVFSLRPNNANLNTVSEKDKFSSYSNYFLSSDRSKWKTRVPAYKTLVYQNVYPFVDWEVSSDNTSVKHSFIIHKGGKAEDVSILYKGVDDVTVQDNVLYIHTRSGVIQEGELYVYQKEDTAYRRIEAQYLVQRAEQGFEVSYKIGRYDTHKDLIIDPGLVFSTYSGSYSDNWGMTSCYDRNSLFVSGGVCEGAGYPVTEGSYDKEFSGNWDCVITKYDSLGQNLIFSTYLGGLYGEMPHSMTVNSNNEIIIFGTTGSFDFPVSEDAYQKEFKGGEPLIYDRVINYPSGLDIFLTLLSADGDELIASSFIGGRKNDGFNFKGYFNDDTRVLYTGNDTLYTNYGDCARGEVITDKNNNVYIASCTFSEDFPVTPNAFGKKNAGGQDAVVFKTDRKFSSLIYSSYIGGSKDDAAYSLDLDNQNRIYICGGTASDDFPVFPNAYKPVFNGGSADGFVSYISQDGSSLLGSTYFGSDAYDQSFFVRLDKQGRPNIFGQTKASGSELIHNAFYARPNSGQFVACLTPSLRSVVFSTVFGTGDGRINISPSGFAVDVCGRIYCAGWGRIFKYTNWEGLDEFGTTGMDVTPDAFMTETDGIDFYIMCMEEGASALKYATFFGETAESLYRGNDHVDGGTSRFDRYGSLYLTVCASCGSSQSLPVTDNAYSVSNNSGNCNMASVKFSVNDDFAVADFVSSPVGCTNSEVRFDNYSRGSSFVWDFGDGTPLQTEKNPVHTYLESGLYTVQLSVSMPSGCKTSDTLSGSILVLGNGSWYLDTVYTCPGFPSEIGFGELAVMNMKDVSFSWTPAEYLSDASSPNPYATVSVPTLFRLIVKTRDCFDTIYQYVGLDMLESEIPDTLSYCYIPYKYEIENTLNRNLECSYDRDFANSEIMTDNGKSVIIKDTLSRWLYVRFYQNGCFGTDSIWLDYTGIEYKLEITHEGCTGQRQGRAEIICPDTHGVHYSWSVTQQDVAYLENLSAGEYSVRIYDENGCYVDENFSILSTDRIVFNAEVSDAGCNGVCDGRINCRITSGYAPYLYSWNTGQTDSVIEQLCKGEYVLTVIDGAGCMDSRSFRVNNKSELSVDISKTNNSCYEGCSAMVVARTQGGIPPYDYRWSNGQSGSYISDVCNGEYYLTVTDSQGCFVSDTFSVDYTDRITGFEAYIDKEYVYDGQEIYLSSTYIENFYYHWEPSEHLKNPDNYATQGRVYENTVFKVTATDRKGCEVSDTVAVKVEYVECGKPNFFVPNIFTPNNDGKNDVLYVTGEYIGTLDFAVYNRWGERVFHTDNAQQGWDGKYRNEECASGVYYYKLEIHCVGGKTYLTSGDITLVR